MKEEYSDSIDTSIDIDVVDVNMSKIYPADIPDGIPENALTDALDSKESTVAQDVTIQEDTETSENEAINEQNNEKDFICEDTEDEENEDINEQDTKKDFICEDTEDEENEDINEQDNEEDFTCEDSEDRENDKIACADVIKDLVDQNVTKSHLPQNGEWSDPSAKGNSDFIMSDDAIIKWGRGEKDKCTGAELKQWMRENYDTDSVRYNHKEPDFSLFIDNKIGQIHLDRMPTKRNGGSYSQAEK